MKTLDRRVRKLGALHGKGTARLCWIVEDVKLEPGSAGRVVRDYEVLREEGEFFCHLARRERLSTSDADFGLVLAAGVAIGRVLPRERRDGKLRGDLLMYSYPATSAERDRLAASGESGGAGA
jgi:hypothetical protein